MFRSLCPALRGPILAVALTCAAGIAFAQDHVEADNPEKILQIARGFGSAELEKDTSGDPMIRGRLGGVRYNVYFYGCEKGKECDSIQFWTFIDAPETDLLVAVNDWNRDHRFGKAYIDADGDVAIELDVNLWGGVTPKNLDDTFDWWRVVLEKSRQAFGDTPGPRPPIQPGAGGKTL
jgi:hypothetical protein